MFIMTKFILPYPYVIYIDNKKDLLAYHEYIKNTQDYELTNDKVLWIMQYIEHSIADLTTLPAFLGEQHKGRAAHCSITQSKDAIYDMYFNGYLEVPIDALLCPEQYPEYYI
jgi:hypothetical protein